MKKRNNRIFFLNSCILAPIFVLTASAQERSFPNVLLVVADDLGWGQMGCYGSNYYQTPNIDSFAKSGVLFKRAYSSAPVCSPTRASLFTGKNPARIHLTNYIPESSVVDGVLNKKLEDPEWQKFLPLEEITIAEVLKKIGYKTALFGKWHLSQAKSGTLSLPYNPDKQGFDEILLTYKPSWNLPRQPWQKPDLDAHNTDTITNRATKFIENNVSRPFFLSVCYDAVHDPLMERPESIRRYKELNDGNRNENNPVLAAMIERLDLAFGRLINCLTVNKLIDNTIIIFISDNGGLENSASQSPLKKGKGWLYEGGIRVPLIFAWNNSIAHGAVSETPVITDDIFPTILDLAGINYSKKNIDGISIVPLLKGDNYLKRKAIFWNYPHYHNGPPSAAILKGDYKLIEWYEKSLMGEMDSAYELYDIRTDIEETKNLTDSLRVKTKELAKDLQKWRRKVGAQIPKVAVNQTTK